MVEAGLDLIEAGGIEALTVRGVARRLGVSHAAPAHHFPDKLALLAAVAAEGYRRFGAALRGAAAEAPHPRQRLARIGMAYLRFALDHPATFRLMFGRELAHCAEAPTDLREASATAYAVLESEVEKVAGEPSPIHALAAWSLVHGAALLYLDGPVRERLSPGNARAEFERAMEVILSGELDAPSARASASARAAPPRPRKRGRR